MKGELITLITLEDSLGLAMLHAQAFDKSWNAAEFEALIAANAQGLKIESNANIIAFILWRQAADEVEILTLATHSAYQRLGYANSLIKQLQSHANTSSFTRIFLEVRADNEAAMQLYNKNNFIQLALRKNYYQLADGNDCDAVVMEWGREKS